MNPVFIGGAVTALCGSAWFMWRRGRYLTVVQAVVASLIVAAAVSVLMLAFLLRDAPWGSDEVARSLGRAASFH